MSSCMVKKAEQKIQSKENILRVAYEEFSKSGIARTSTLQVAQAAQLSHGSLFAHFPNRDSLVLAVIDQFGVRLAEALHRSAENCHSVKELLECHLEVLQEFEPFYTQLVIEGPLLPPNIRNAVFLIQSGVACFLERCLRKDIQKGRFKALPLHLLLNTWLGLLHYYLSHHVLFANDASVLKRHGKHLVNFMTTTILSKKESV